MVEYTFSMRRSLTGTSPCRKNSEALFPPIVRLSVKMYMPMYATYKDTPKKLPPRRPRLRPPAGLGWGLWVFCFGANHIGKLLLKLHRQKTRLPDFFFFSKAHQNYFFSKLLNEILYSLKGLGSKAGSSTFYGWEDGKGGGRDLSCG